MKFEISERLKTAKGEEGVLDSLEEHFKKVSDKIRREGKEIIIEEVDSMFFTGLKRDVTTIKIQKKETGYLCVAATDYRMSWFFWALVILAFFTAGVSLLFQVGYYLYLRRIVKDAISGVLRRVKDDIED